MLQHPHLYLLQEESQWIHFVYTVFEVFAVVNSSMTMSQAVSHFGRCVVPDSSHRGFGLNLFLIFFKKVLLCHTCGSVRPVILNVALLKSQGNMANIPTEMHLSARPGVISICLFNLLNLLVSSTGRA